MADSEWHTAVGDHRLVTIPDAETTVTFNMASPSTSSSDTATNKYFDNLSKSVIQFNIVADQDILVTALDGKSLTDPIPINANTVYQEGDGKYDSITIRTSAANTQISLRVR
jgi:hypothetical protein